MARRRSTDPGPAGPTLAARRRADGPDDDEAARRRAAGLGNAAAAAHDADLLGRSSARTSSRSSTTSCSGWASRSSLVGRPFDALVSLAVIATNVIVGVVQEIRAKRTLDRIALLTRPTATVVRDGEAARSARSELVAGRPARRRGRATRSCSTAGSSTGDDRARRVAAHGRVRRRPQAPRRRGVLRQLRDDRRRAATSPRRSRARSFANQITAGARVVPARAHAAPERDQPRHPGRARDRALPRDPARHPRRRSSRRGWATSSPDATLLAGLVPNGLFVSIAVAYALGAVRILRFGALVQQSNAIESLSHVDVLCLDKTGTLTANRLAVEAVAAARRRHRGRGHRRAVGARRAAPPPRNKTSEAIAARWPRDAPPRWPREVPFSSARKWSAVAFADAASDALPGHRRPRRPDVPAARTCAGDGRTARPTAGRRSRRGRPRLARPGPARAAGGRPTRTPRPCRPDEDDDRGDPARRACARWASSRSSDELRARGRGDARVVPRGRRAP